jgi:hypothetical protein
MSTSTYGGARPMVGWIVFAATMLMVLGSIDFIEGLIAAIRKHYYVATPSQIIVFNTQTWGWLTLLWGIVIFLAGLSLWRGASWARWFAVVVVCINLIGQLMWLGSSGYVVWTLTVIAIDFMVIYALLVRWEGYSEMTA